MMNNIACPCKRTNCERYGNCSACRSHHETDKRTLPACERIAAKKERKAVRAKRGNKK